MRPASDAHCHGVRGRGAAIILARACRSRMVVKRSARPSASRPATAVVHNGLRPKLLLAADASNAPALKRASVAPTTRRLGSWPLLVAVLAVALVGCGASSSDKESSSAAIATRSANSARRIPACPNSEGGECLGRLSAGTYHTSVFAPAITYRVPEGWRNFEDTPGNFLLVPPHQSLKGVNAGTSDYIGVYTAVAAAAQDCSELPAPNAARSPTAIARWMTRLPGVIATRARQVEVSGLRGVVLELSMEKGWKETCSWSGDTPVVLLIVGVPPSGLTHGLIPGLALRLYLLRHDNITLAIEVDDVSGGTHLTNYAAVVKQIRFAH